MITEVRNINTKLTKSKMPVTPKSKKNFPTTDYSRRKLDMFYQYWTALGKNRREWRRWAKYYDGSQWHERVDDGMGGTMTEAEHISSQGKLPLQQNIIKPTVNSIIGQFRSNRGKPVVVARAKDKAQNAEKLSNVLQYVHQLNYMKEMDAAALEQKLVTGIPIQMVTYKYQDEEKRYDVQVDNISCHRVFFNTDATDIRGKDIRIIGRLIDMTFPQLAIAFGNNNRAQIKKLREIYAHRDDIDYVANEGMSGRNVYDQDFFMPKDFNQCRVIEAWEKVPVIRTRVHDWADGSLSITDWTLEEIMEMNRQRVQMYINDGQSPDDALLLEAEEVVVQVWHYQYLTPFGHVLMEGESPYWHGSHHFVMPLFQLFDGMINSFVSSLIDQQRYINRLITLWDFILGTSAKNTLIVDKDSLDGQTVEDIAEVHARVGGVIALKLKDGAKPPIELGKNMANLGITDMIRLHMELVQDISGVHASLQGKQPSSGTPASLYAQEAQNASVNIKSVMDSFNMFRRERDEKVLKTIQQFWTEPRWITVSGSSYDDKAMLIEPKDVQDLEFHNELAQSAESPVYRGVIDEQLKEFLFANLIDFKTYLKNTNLPFSDKLLEDIKVAEEQAANGQQMPPMQGENPQAQEIIRNGLMR